MLKIVLVLVFTLCLGLTSCLFAQDTTQKTHDLLAALDKTKYKKKEKKDFKIELYVDVKNEPVVKNTPAEYTGLYRSLDDDSSLELRVDEDGSATGSGKDSGANFILKDGRVEGALLTASKVYENGQTEKLQAVFATRTVSQGTSPSDIATIDTKYGIGFIQTHGEWTNRVFLEFRK